MPRTMKRGDSYPALELVVSDANGTVDLTAADTITVYAKFGVTLVTKEGEAVLPQTGADKGRLTADIDPTDFQAAGTFEVEVEVEWSATPGENRQTFPSSGYETLTIEPDLGA